MKCLRNNFFGGVDFAKDEYYDETFTLCYAGFRFA